MPRTKEQMISAAIAKRVLSHEKKRTRTIIREEYERYFDTMANQSSSTMSGLNVQSSDVVVAKRPAPLMTPQEQQSHAEEPVSRLGSSTDKPRVSPTDYAGNNNAIVDNMSVNSTDGGAFTVKRDSYTQVEGKGAGPSTYRGQGDVAKAAVDKAADNGGVRSTIGQFQTSKDLPNQKLPFTSPVAGSEGDRA
jgi:hypothetical protein